MVQCFAVGCNHAQEGINGVFHVSWRIILEDGPVRVSKNPFQIVVPEHCVSFNTGRNFIEFNYVDWVTFLLFNLTGEQIGSPQPKVASAAATSKDGDACNGQTLLEYSSNTRFGKLW